VSTTRPPALGAADRIRGEIAAIVERFADADRAMKRAEVYEDAGAREEAQAAREAAQAAFGQAGRDLADLALLLLRYALLHDRDALRLILTETLREELEPALDAVARLEGPG
jgi:hypothetical protein